MPGLHRAPRRLPPGVPGLALEIKVFGNGTAVISGIWDYRDDPEGMCFAPGMLTQEKADKVAAERARHAEVRKALFDMPTSVEKTDVQPIDWEPADG